MNAYRLVRPLLFALPAETAHQLTHRCGEWLTGTPIESALERRLGIEDERLHLDRFGQSFSTPLGVAAGFDKNARIPNLLGSLGFGHVEIGAVTARPQVGNPRPRLFRLESDRALINRMGFNNDGADRIADRLATAAAPELPVGVNLGLSKGVPDAYAPADYRYTYERLATHGDFFVINVSSPNTPGLRGLQQRERLERIVGALQDAGASPLLVKLSPDLTETAAEDVLEVVEGRSLDGLVATNTTTARPTALAGRARDEEGGLSGRPLTGPSTRWIRFLAARTSVPIVGVGGIFTAEDAYQKLRAGASLLQLYTALIYEGPGLARTINRGLLDRLDRDGYDHVEDAIGVDLD